MQIHCGTTLDGILPLLNQLNDAREGEILAVAGFEPATHGL